MLYLLIVSLLWGFSFGLVKTGFSDISGSTLAMLRLAIALPCFLPFLGKQFRRLDYNTVRLMGIGAIQYGLMYVCLFSSFTHLTGYEVALLTIFTPLYVILVDAFLTHRKPPAWFWWTALLAVAGAFWIFNPKAVPEKISGILLMQVANLCFALGQVAYRKLRLNLAGSKDHTCYAWLYAGAVLATIPFALVGSPISEIQSLDGNQWLALLYLGSIASGLAFFLWNSGAVRVNTATLAVFNNLKIPLATLISILVFKEAASLDRLVPGLVILLVALGWAELAARKRTTSGN
ncbi:MAG: DMT family transporter [Puniceicoccaceae bacterium]